MGNENEKSQQKELEASLENKYQTAVNDLKRSYEHHVDRLEDKITAKNSQITEAAIDKTFKVLYPILALFGAAIAILSYFGYDDVRSSVINHTTTKVDSWLSFEENESPLKDSLLDIRDRYLLDSVYLRYLRSRAEGNRVYDFKLSEKELSDLVRIANDKDTSHRDYADILNIYASNFILGSIKFRGDYKGSIFSAVFTDSGFKDQRYKQQEFLKIFSHDYSIYPIAKQVLDKNEEYLRYESLNAVANINPPEAVKYANKHLNGKTFEPIDLEMARLLAKEDPSSTKLKEYIAQLLAAKDNLDGWLYQYFELFSLMNIPDKDDHFFTPRNNAKDTTKKEIAETMLAQLIDDEYLIHISNDRFDKKLRISESGKRSTYLSRSDADRIYKNERLLNDLISRKPNDITWLRKIVSCLEVKTRDKYIVTLHTDLHPNSSITTDGDSPLQKDKIFGKVWLTVSDEGKLVASYRDHAGEIRRGKVKMLNNFSESKFSYQYIEKDLHAFIEEEKYF